MNVDKKEFLYCPFSKRYECNGWGGKDGNYPTAVNSYFGLCIEEKCALWTELLGGRCSLRR